VSATVTLWFNVRPRREALLSVLAGDIYDGTPIWSALRLFKALYYLHLLRRLPRSLRARAASAPDPCRRPARNVLMHARQVLAHAPALRLETAPAALLATRPAAWWNGVLGMARYAAVPQVALPALPRAEVQVAALDGSDEPCEVWCSGSDVLQEGCSAGVHWRADGTLLFAALQLPVRIGTMQVVSREAYAALLETLDAQGYPHLLRVWNHLGEINGETDGLECYRRFNVGRQDALLAQGRGVAGSSVPAASALGANPGAPLTVYALAQRVPPRAIENPRQLSAYHYPAQYGPRAPTFSRAALSELGGPLLFISGTASIVGHRSMHAGDVGEQTREILRNLRALLQQAQAQGAPVWQLPDLHCKVYLRDAGDYPQVRAVLQAALGPQPRALFLHADICRSDLQVEIEAVALPADERA